MIDIYEKYSHWEDDCSKGAKQLIREVNEVIKYISENKLNFLYNLSTKNVWNF